MDIRPLGTSPHSQDPGLQPLLSGLQAGTFWNPGAPPSCLLTCAATLPVAKRGVPQRLVSKSHAEGAEPPTLPRAVSQGAMSEHSLELGGLDTVGPAERGEGAG